MSRQDSSGLSLHAIAPLVSSGVMKASFYLRAYFCLQACFLLLSFVMVLVIMHMKVPYGKRKELSQAITSLLGLIRTAEGCLRCDFFHSMEDEQILCLFEEWDSRKNLEKHRNSECFRVLRGAMHLLEEPCEIISYGSLHQGDT